MNWKRKPNIGQKLVAVLFTLTLVLSLLPFSARAEESGSCGAGLTWTFDGNALSITGEGEMDDFTEPFMAPWYRYAPLITSVTVAPGVTSIGEIAFYGCNSLTNVLLPSSVRSIHNRAFEGCASLAYLNLPAGLEQIGEASFSRCTALNGIRFPNGLLSVGDNAFYRCTSLSSIVIPESIEEFGMVVFAYCTALVRVEILCPITKLPDWTFYGCTSLTALALPETLTEIGDNALYSCDGLADVHYTGEASEEVYDQIVEQDPNLPSVGGITPVDIDSEASSGLQTDEETQTGTIISVVQEEDVVVTVEQHYEYSEEQTTDVGAVISAVVDNDAGMKELSAVVNTVLSDREEAKTPVQLDLQLSGSELSGDWINQYTGENLVLNITTDQGASWQMKMQDVGKQQLDPGKVYDLSYKLSSVENAKDISGDSVYQLSFASDIDISSRVSVKLGADYAGHYATLYEKNGKVLHTIENVMIDNSGTAWFSLSNVGKDTEFYVGVDAADIGDKNSTIPENMYEKMGGLMDAQGNRYQITGRKSNWGIDFKTVLFILGGFLIVVAIVVGVVMTMLNKRKLAKAGGPPIRSERTKPDNKKRRTKKEKPKKR